MSDGILIRCDADAAVGLGHLMRCLAIAGALRDLGVRVEFAMGELSSFAAQTLQDEGFCVHDVAGANSTFDKSAANAMLQLIADRQLESILVDHYGASAEYFETLSDHTKLLGVIDDQAIRDFPGVGWLLNPNPSVSAGEYQVSDDAEVLIGPQYALLRLQFRIARESAVGQHDARRTRILIQFGGSDTRDVCERVLGWLGRISAPCSITCIAAEHADILRRSHRDSAHDIAILPGVADIAEHMLNTDIAIGAGGSSCWELCCVGVPMIIGELSPDQSRIAQELHNRGAAIHLGQWNHVAKNQFIDAVQVLIDDRSRRNEMAQIGRGIVDGLGAKRAAQSIVKTLRAKQEVVA
ncbi:MAG TPA: UDP-2,4-diacetamido-2,4,6-trideoxy-beta-L-altropyranose hydrolase [Phycisphaerae bacterium]|nr:UDP-2,4-diacetamido-2,4,6-trideoxy-beta-L-altropyranose hydrolase [Phycisphaerae bacterium]